MAQSVAEFLANSFPEVSPMDYYRELFPIGSLEKQGQQIDGVTGLYCPIAIQINDEGKARRVHITDGLPQLPSLIESDEFAMLAPVAFAGKRASKENARLLFALEFDLDFVREDEKGEPIGLHDLLYQTSIIKEDPFNRLPKPTYLIASSYRNLHVVYLLEEPLPMYSTVMDEIRNYRKAFIPKLWDSWICTAYETPQYETSPVQAFRLCGSKSKDKSSKVRCFRVGDKVSIEYMNSYVDEQSQIKSVYGKSTYTKEQAKELFPEWYERRIEHKAPAYSWIAHKGLYEWWKRRVNEVKVGHRYHYLLCMACYSVKCGIDKDQLVSDVMNARKQLDRLSPPNNPLTISDAMNAIQGATEAARYATRETISKWSGLKIEPSKRNGRTKDQHMKYLNGMNAVKRSIGENLGAGRPSKQALVIEYKKNHPEASIREIAKALGVSKTTVHKWINHQ